MNTITSLSRLQPVVFITKDIVNEIQFRNLPITKIFDYSIVSKILAPELLDEFLILNSSELWTRYIFPECSEYLVNVSVYDNILTLWHQTATDNLVKDSTIKFTDSLFKEMFKNREMKTDRYSVFHCEDAIFVAVDPDRINLLDIGDDRKGVCTDIIKSYCFYHPYSDIAISPWYKCYIQYLKLNCNL